MKTSLIVRSVVVACALGGAATVAAQSVSQSQERIERSDAKGATLEAVLGELRALRAEMTRASTASVRVQLLVARLALQEQRLAVVGRDIADVQEKLRAHQQSLPVVSLLRSIEKDDERKDGPPEESRPWLDAIRGQADHLERTDRELKERYAELSRILAEEQSRWTSFNAQLEALERELGK